MRTMCAKGEEEEDEYNGPIERNMPHFLCVCVLEKHHTKKEEKCMYNVRNISVCCVCEWKINR